MRTEVDKNVKNTANTLSDRDANQTYLRFTKTHLRDAWLIEPVPFNDARGSFTRTFCQREFAKQGVQTIFVQHSCSRSHLRGTVRGMHFQRAPHTEIKIVSCRRGAIWDVIIDLRPKSPTYGRWQGFELTADNHHQVYVPAGFAHGFQSLSGGAEVSYLISEFYVPEAAAGVRYDDPAFLIDWPLPVAAISERDRSWPNFAR
ncbi:dTDP-4-dehydrorhamnose 3,5-epimerase [Dongia deserti]|uniref:dTDP-4-dehydrorhamnose 3,5-epimerase n=1 Tax=Dongia deserti TaxID=2268030 RepID=UPI002549596E|nr:dTDP-4-dehydrorhamnose 3,5-epimerase [Dongia deserti]